MRSKLQRICTVAGLLCAITSWCQSPAPLALTGDFQGTHDPSVMKEGDTWYVFATGKAKEGGQFQIRCSTDLHAWKLCRHVFDEVPAWIRQDSPGTKDLWAPDISYENGEYRLYYAYSLFGKNTSGIALATNKTLNPASPDYKWIDRGLILKSTAGDDFNAIDPNFILDTHGHAWLSFGSFWSGIKMRRLDDATGKLSSTDTKVYSLATRKRPDNPPPAPPNLPANWEAVEAPFIVHHGKYFYLFVSWDLCCRGVKSTYRTMVGRARQVTGPYLDRAGVPMMQGGGTEILKGNARWLGPGGESAFTGKDGQSILVFHAYDAQTGHPALQISSISWSHDWPEVALGN
jgi:arabinan endo-1,5-alpha-L-arabinosidase